ncbi:Leucine-rich repeat-containing G-protein coupled receptor 5 [Frankliniella fusca]|uniref:Leucine-rich repeat-containing G-protein coupled receptor 5 n=1 Tax=Frankliniella fusca TaxID=407009 RepID=A0AAE1H4D8_9NEOP|nr:Leucine-rich repeat-containing G-protein coupled receptor 5 [Frankliniella fusca]
MSHPCRQLDQNEIAELPGALFESQGALRNLRLESNQLDAVPTRALQPLRSLEALNLGTNQLDAIRAGDFPQMDSLVILLLKRNQISYIDEKAFANLTSLRVLELDDNLLTHIPEALSHLTSLQELSVSGNRIKYIPEGALQKSPGLALLELKGNPLAGVHPRAFSFLPKLRKLILSDARDLTEFPSLNGTAALEILRLDRASLREVPASLCITCPKLKSLDMKSNKLTRVPELSACKELRVLDLASNGISSLEGRPFTGLRQLHDLLLSHNAIKSLPQDALDGLTKLQVLDLEANGITYIHPEAFLAASALEDLNLGNNLFPGLPPAGLERLLHLKTFNNPNLRDFPAPAHFPRVQTLVLSYAYHCCPFLPLIPAEAPPKAPLHEAVLFPTDNEFDMSLWNSSLTDIWPQLQNLSDKFGTQINELWDSFGADFTYPGNLPAYVEEYFEEQENRQQTQESTGRIQCLPLPGPFLPCQDLFDWWTLRCGVWVVFLLAMLGNGTVVFVLVFSRSKIDVPRFLVCNLAAADFFMGVYLGFLAVVDASTLGEFRMYAIPWQMSVGCQLAGFLGVLSAELSVYTLAVITLERNYAITHAMHLNKRLSLRHASYIMACGWAFALIMAVLPLFGVSDYRKFAICLPFETTTGPVSLAYVVFLMLINGVAFLILMGCYLKMYCAIRGSQAWNSNDSRIAKRMALLVFTDFLCWSPIAFFSLTAAFGLQLVSLEQAKVFTVFVLPLNSCCNPFLYAILTKQFKKDCVLICKAIEESRVTRGIGRCRHSSNFSNRQTPANTNSLVDRSSREHPGHPGHPAHPHPHTKPCHCSAKLLSDSTGSGSRAADGRDGSTPTGRGGRGAGAVGADGAANPRVWLLGKLQCLLLCARRDTEHRPRSDQYAYQIAEIQQKQHKRASSVSSSENFSSSRSDSWRQHQHHCGIPMRLLDPKRRASSWLVTRKTSQDSNLSSSRNDSSGSATTASTSTWRMSRSSASSDVRGPLGTLGAMGPLGVGASASGMALGGSAAGAGASAACSVAAHAGGVGAVGVAGVAGVAGLGPAAAGCGGVDTRPLRPKPRLTRQSAIHDDLVLEPPGSPGRLTVRFLTTIPSAAETSVQQDDEQTALTAGLGGSEAEAGPGAGAGAGTGAGTGASEAAGDAHDGDGGGLLGMDSPLLVDNVSAAGARLGRRTSAVVVASMSTPAAVLALRRNSQPAPSSGRFGKS